MCAIVVNLLEQSLEGDTRFAKVIPLYDLGGATQNLIALVRGQIDLYPAYIVTGLKFAYPSVLTPATVCKELLELEPAPAQQALNELFDPYFFVWLAPTGFRND